MQVNEKLVFGWKNKEEISENFNNLAQVSSVSDCENTLNDSCEIKCLTED